MRQAFRIFALLIAVGLAGAAEADTIILKNGRQIVAANVTTAGGKVTFETAAGFMSLPERLVLRIEKDSLGSLPSGVANRAAADLPISPPAVDQASNDDPLARSVVRDGIIDQKALAEIDAKAATGGPQAVARAIAAESAASRLEFDQGNLNAALEHSERALALAPAQTALLLNVAYLHLRRAEYLAALDCLERARSNAPDSADVAKLAGWANYGLNRLPRAVAEWNRAQAIKPDPEIDRALAKVQREQEVAGNFREGESAHFSLRYYGGAAPELARAVSHALEDDFDSISAALNYVPKQPISVILYTNEAFRDITRAPSWVGALNDGKIRVPVQGLQSLTPELERVLKHELTHSFISEQTHGRCPVWIQEGTAQWMEGKRARDSSAALLEIYDRHQDPSLALLEGSWMNLPSDFVGFAYAWSLAVIEGLQTTSPGDLERVLERIADGTSAESAVRSTLHMTYADLGSATADYLRRAH
jgi:tetratricopeptide (TPR) repeat protein